MTKRKLTDAEKVSKYQRKLASLRRKLARETATVEEHWLTICELRRRLHTLHGKLAELHTDAEAISDKVWAIAAGCYAPVKPPVLD